MNLEEAKAVLSTARRDECRDHAFGDCEVYWRNGDEEVAYGYFGGESREVRVKLSIGEVAFAGDEADELRSAGQRGLVGRNDSTGPDDYREGECMPGLTKEGVLRELTCHPDYDPDVDDFDDFEVEDGSCDYCGRRLEPGQTCCMDCFASTHPLEEP